MKTEARFQQETRNRVRISRARAFIRAHALESITLAAVAAAANASPFHFARLFSGLTGETVFGYVTRVRLREAAWMLAADPRRPVTDVALAVGYQTPSAFNRVFRGLLGVSPTRFRTASPRQRQRLLAPLEDPRRRRAMTLDLSPTPEIRTRATRPYLHISRTGECAEEAPAAWETLNRILAAAPPMPPDAEYIGASMENPQSAPEQGYRYDAGVAIGSGAAGVPLPPGLTRGTLDGGRYAVFRYRGPYRFIWNAVDQIFRGWVAQARPTLRAAPLLEVYVNDPRTTPEADLLTDLCIPID